MQCSVTVVNLIHDTATEIDRPACHVIPGSSWREKLDTSGMDRADRDYYETLKERFALPDGLKGVRRNETLQEHEDAFLDRFG